MAKQCIKCSEHKPESAFPKSYNECRRCKHDRENSFEGRMASRERELQRRYGIDLDQYNLLLARQDCKCACCGEYERRTNRFGERMPLSVDHDHRTGQVRGLLCANCNKGIGALGDSIPSLYRAIVYLFRSLRNA